MLCPFAVNAATRFLRVTAPAREFFRDRVHGVRRRRLAAKVGRQLVRPKPRPRPEAITTTIASRAWRLHASWIQQNTVPHAKLPVVRQCDGWIMCDQQECFPLTDQTTE